MATSTTHHHRLNTQAGVGRRGPFTWDELASWRWGPAVGDSTPGIDLGRPELAGMAESPPLDADAQEYPFACAGIGDNWSHSMGPEGELQTFLERLNIRGFRLDGELIHPKIAVGTLTGRVTYTKPSLQRFSRADRLRRFFPVVTGRAFVKADYGQIEPRILLAVLRRRGLIAWEAGGDLYRDLIADSAVDRDTVKRIVNKLINGGRAELGATGKLAEFVEATESYRVAVATDARERGYVETLAGRGISLAAEETNHGGKAVNRVVQGTAADIFNRAAVRADSALTAARVPAAIAFLLYDELWVDCDPDAVAMVVELVRSEMTAAAQELDVIVPVRIDTPVGIENTCCRPSFETLAAALAQGVGA